MQILPKQWIVTVSESKARSGRPTCRSLPAKIQAEVRSGLVFHVLKIFPYTLLFLL